MCTRHASALRPQLAPVDPELESLPGWLRENCVVGRRAWPNQRTEEGYPKPVSGKTFLTLLKVEKVYSNVCRVVIIIFNKLFLHFLTFFLKKSQISRTWGYLLIASVFFTGYLVQVATYNTTHQCISHLIFILESSVFPRGEWCRVITNLPIRRNALEKYFMIIPLKNKLFFPHFKFLFPGNFQFSRIRWYLPKSIFYFLSGAVLYI